MAAFIHISATASVSLTTAYPAQGAIFTATSATVPNSLALNEQAYLSIVQLNLSTIAGGAAQVTWFLAADLDGNAPITPEQTDAILDHDTDASGTVVRTLEIFWNRVISGNVYLFAKLDAGTANGFGALTWSEATVAREA